MKFYKNIFYQILSIFLVGVFSGMHASVSYAQQANAAFFTGYQQALQLNPQVKINYLSNDPNEFTASWKNKSIKITLIHGDGSSFRVNGSLFSIDLNASTQESSENLAKFLRLEFPEQFSTKSSPTQQSFLETILHYIHPQAHAANIGFLIATALVIAVAVVLTIKSNQKSKNNQQKASSKKHIPKKENIPYNLGKGDYFLEKKNSAGKPLRHYHMPENPTAADCQKGARYYHDWAKKGHNLDKSEFTCPT